MALPFRQQPEFLRGRAAEQRVAAILQQADWYVIPSYDYSGEDGNRAPKIQGLRDGIVLPDLDIAKRGYRRWAEVKAKAYPNYTVKTQTLDHGISLRKFISYLRVQDETGCSVCLFIIEENSQILLVDRLDWLATRPSHIYEGDKMDRGGMIFWPRDAFRTRIVLDACPGLFDIPLREIA